MKIKEFCKKYKKYEYKDQKEFDDLLEKVNLDCIFYVINGYLVLVCYNPDIDNLIDDEVFCIIADPNSDEFVNGGVTTLAEVSKNLNKFIKKKTKKDSNVKSIEFMKNLLYIAINMYVLGFDSDTSTKYNTDDEFELDIQRTITNMMVNNMYKDFEETYLKKNVNLEDIRIYRDVLGIFALKVDKKYRELAEKE